MKRTSKPVFDQKGISKEDATKRSIEDYSQFSQHIRVLVQYTFAANGGAAAAMLSFMTALLTSTKGVPLDKLSLLIKYLAGAASFYLLGVLAALVGLTVLLAAKKNWGHFWEEMANTTAPGDAVRADFNNRFALRGEMQDAIGHVVLVIASILFVPGSIVTIIGFVYDI